jgi:hypothetical protein
MKRRTFIECAAATVAATALPINRLLAATVPGDLPARTLTGGETVIPRSAVEDFIASLRGDALLANDAGYDAARRIWNGAFDRRPAIIARCAGAADVSRSVNFARAHSLLVAVRGGGHSISGQSACDGGLMIDLSPMRSVRVDPLARRAFVGAGSLLGDLDRESAAFGLVTTAGTVSHTGAAGLTLGGGQGRLHRLHGLACDNLRAADVITADGQFLRANEQENRDLFWALRGGGGNFGVVTSFEYELHPFSGTILGGEIVYPLEQARDALRFYADYTRSIPDELYLTIAAMHPSGGKPVVSVEACYAGELREGERVIAPLRRFGKPAADKIAPMPYLKIQSGGDEAFAPGRLYYIKSGFVQKIDEALFDVIRRAPPVAPGLTVATLIQQFGGAMSRVPADATAYPGRNAAYEVLMFGAWTDRVATSGSLAALRSYWAKLAPFTKGFYINTAAEADDQERMRANFGDNYDRLVKIKTQYDPSNLFRLNPNIKPLGS